MSDLRPPIFVVGTPRSGTTLLSEILGAHSDVAMAPETHYYNVFAQDCDREGCLEKVPSRRRFVERLLSSEAFEAMAFPEDVEDRVLSALEVEASHGRVLGSLLSAHAEVKGAARPAEKTPRHIEWVPRILEEHPQARVVSVVRDPRDVALSQDRAPWETTIWRSVKDWRRHQAMADDYRERFPERFQEVRYEDVLGDPEGTVQDVCGFLDLRYEERMMAFHEEEAASFEEDAEPWKQKAREPIDPSNKGKWRDQMGAVDRWIVERLSGDGLEERDYEASDPRLGFADRVRLAGMYVEHLGRWSLHQARWILHAKILPPDYTSPLDDSSED